MMGWKDFLCVHVLLVCNMAISITLEMDAIIAPPLSLTRGGGTRDAPLGGEEGQVSNLHDKKYCNNISNEPP